MARVLRVGAYIRSEFDGPGDHYLTVAAPATFVGTLVVGMHQAEDGLKVRKLTSDLFALTGVSREFAEAVASQSEVGGPARFQSGRQSSINPRPT